ncbi:hypothetical protein FSP39_012653 [Pinctada imbricata]|uniref:Orange domain-containing protein n=1 Tax=Pinctada imbricata TaxID=66713 RepID=A0AA89C0Q0_PINIB|nr:hypothetical protein FSP39_012653 [Pinctada imbricata]
MRKSEMSENTTCDSCFAQSKDVICNENISQVVPNAMEVPTETQVTQHPAMIGLSPLQQAEVVLSGYRDCAAEAIRYLTEVENIPADDPLVLGLQSHLHEKQKHLDFVQILIQYHNTMNSTESHDADLELGSLDDSGVSLQSETDPSLNFDTIDENIVSDCEPTSEHISQDVNIVSSTNCIVQSEQETTPSASITALAEEILSLIEEGMTSDSEKIDDFNEQ